MSDTATLTRIFSGIEQDLEAVDALFRERASSNLVALNDASIHILGSQGKRLRTAITLLSGKIFGYQRDRLISLSAGFEMMHLASLVHDDIIDKASTRRNLPTVNSLFGDEIAILLGDFYFAKTAGLIADVNDNRVDRLFSDTVAAIVEGAILEMLDARHIDMSYGRYIERIRGKTSCLIAACCKGGAMVCGASDEQIHRMWQFGDAVGIAFQIIDDVLDYQGTTDSIGKPAGNDLLQGMVTLPLIYALEHAGHDRYEQVKLVLQDPLKYSGEAAEVIAWVNTCGATQQAMNEAERYGEQARQILYSLPVSAIRNDIEQMIDFVLRRSR